MPSHTGHHIYRCTPATRNRAYHGGHVARQARPVEEFGKGARRAFDPATVQVTWNQPDAA
jgi:hypothetical protein